MNTTTIETLYNIYSNATGISTDTRTIQQGNLFFCLKGERFDGNKYANDALQKGASYVVVDDVSFSQKPQHLYVENTLLALQQLANYHRKQIQTKIIAITGTNGKTTTKELLGAVLQHKYKVAITEGNLNNHIGVPLTLLRIRPETEVAIIEMGASKKGDIAELCAIACPNYGLITNIGIAHLQGFGDAQTIQATKAELYDYLAQNNGIAFYNSTDDKLKELITQRDMEKQSVPFGSDTDFISATTSTPEYPYMQLSLHIEGTSYEIPTHLVGEYNGYNMLAAAAIAYVLRVEKKDICKALQDYEPTNHRSQLLQTKRNRLILDCYNANPTGMRAAILNHLKSHERPIFVLGDMKELGDPNASMIEHQSLLTFIYSHNPNCRIYTIGDSFFEAAKQSFPEVHSYNDRDQLKAELSQISNETILLKASRAMKMEEFIEVL